MAFITNRYLGDATLTDSAGSSNNVDANASSPGKNDLAASLSQSSDNPYFRMVPCDTSGDLVDHLLGLEDTVKVLGCTRCGIGQRHGFTANQKDGHTDLTALCLAAHLVQQREDLSAAETMRRSNHLDVYQ